MLHIDNITKSFGAFKAVDGFKLNVEKGHIHGIIGENGAGKTTIIKCIVGIYKPDKGSIKLDGGEVYENPPVKAKIGYVADSNTMFEDYTAAQMVKFFGEVYPNFDKARFDELNKIFKVEPKRLIGRLSKGQQMRLSFMLAISAHPELLVLDEPTDGLDAMAKKQLFDILIDEVEKGETAVVISSHNLNELEKLCDEITILRNGRAEYQSDIEEIHARVKKFQAVFKAEPDMETLRGSFDAVERMGSVYYLTTSAYDENTIPALKAMGAELVEEVGMSLEEIFIATAESR